MRMRIVLRGLPVASTKEWICVWFQGQNSIWKYSHCIRDRAEQEPLVTRAEFSAATNKNDALDMALLQYQGFVA